MNDGLQKQFPLSAARSVSDFIRMDTCMGFRAAFMLALTLPRPLAVFCENAREAENIARELRFFLRADKVQFIDRNLSARETRQAEEWFNAERDAILCLEYGSDVTRIRADLATKLYLSFPDGDGEKGAILVESRGSSSALEALKRGTDREIALGLVRRRPRRYMRGELCAKARRALNEEFRPVFGVNIFSTKDAEALVGGLVKSRDLIVCGFPFTDLIDIARGKRSAAQGVPRAARYGNTRRSSGPVTANHREGASIQYFLKTLSTSAASVRSRISSCFKSKAASSN